MKSKLDVAANVAIIALCLVVGAVLIKNHFLTPTPAAPPSAVDREAEIEGKASPELASLAATHDADRMVVVALAPGCRFCTESMPFYKRLIEERDAQGAGVPVIATVASEEMIEGERQVMDEAQVSPDDLVALSLGDVGVSGTPTLLLVDRDGTVLEAWIGMQQPDGEEEILEAAFG
jgi:thioredoxin-related protein